jgi:ribosome maturation factor RimP
MELNKLVVQIVEQFIENENIFLVDVNVKGNPGNQKIQVFIDGDQYVDVEACSNISRKLSAELEERDIIEGRYVVEVSSPGADKPLKLFRQYKKHVGRELEVVTKENRKYQGRLLETGDNEIELSISSGKVRKEINSETLKLSFEEIDNSKVVIRM